VTISGRLLPYFSFAVASRRTLSSKILVAGAIACLLLVPAPAAATPGLTPAPGALPDGQDGVPYSQAITGPAAGSFTFSISNGSLPPGLAISVFGVISGVPSAAGSYSFTVKADDAGDILTASYTLEVLSTITLSPTTLPDGTKNSAYNQTITASGGAAPYTFAVTSGALPSGLSLSSGGVLSGTPTVVGSFNFTVTATDSTGTPGPYSGNQAYTLEIDAPPITVSLSPMTLPDGTAATAYSQTLTASGATAPYSFAVTSGALPTGLSLASNGSLTGTPTSAGSFTFTVTATDSNPCLGPYSGSQAYTVVIAAAGPVISVAPGNPSLPQATVGESYNETFTATGGSAPYSFSITSGALPPGLSLASNGTLSGTPSTAGSYTFTVTATDSNICLGPYSGGRSYSVNVVAAPVADPPSSGQTENPKEPDVVAPPVAHDVPPSPSTTVTSGSPVQLDFSSLVTGHFDDIEVTAPPSHGTLRIVRGSQPEPAGATARRVTTRATDGARITATYVPNPGYRGTDSFTYVALGPGGRSAAAAVIFEVVGSVPKAASLRASAYDGQRLLVDISGRAAEGPFMGASVVSISPAAAADVSIVETGAGTARTYALQIEPRDRSVDTITVAYTLQNDIGTSAVATVTVDVAARKDPSADAIVRGMTDSQAETVRRFASAQVGNFMRRAEQAHRTGAGADALGIAVNTAVEGDAGAAANALLPSLARNALSQVNARRAAPAAWTRRLSAWSGGALSLGSRSTITQRARLAVETSGLSAGVDAELAHAVTIGVGGGYGRDRTTIGQDGATVEADNWLAAVYGSSRPARGLFVDWMVGGGGVGFDTRRLVEDTAAQAAGHRSGAMFVGALASGIERAAGPWNWSTYGRVERASTRLTAYTEAADTAFELAFASRDVASTAGVLGGRIDRRYPQGSRAWLVGGRGEWLHEFAGSSAQRLDYADVLGPQLYSIRAADWSREQLDMTGTVGLELRSTWRVGGQLGGRLSSGGALWSFTANASKRF
jgi:hypothetical protein